MSGMMKKLQIQCTNSETLSLVHASYCWKYIARNIIALLYQPDMKPVHTIHGLESSRNQSFYVKPPYNFSP
jgi:hypothetical protein